MTLPACAGSRARRNAAVMARRRRCRRDSLFTRQAARHFNGFVVGHLLDAVYHGQVKIGRYEARADALDLVRAGASVWPASVWLMTGECVGFHRHRQDFLALRLFDVARNARQRAPSTDAGHENIHLAVGVFPDFGSGGFSWIAGFAGFRTV